MTRLINLFSESHLSFFFCIEFLTAVFQFRIIDKVWSQKKNVLDYEVAIMMFLVFFNPLQLIRLSINDLGALKDLLLYMTIDSVLNTDPRPFAVVVIQAVIIGI